jgi:hypothetical protein
MRSRSALSTEPFKLPIRKRDRARYASLYICYHCIFGQVEATLLSESSLRFPPACLRSAYARNLAGFGGNAWLRSPNGSSMPRRSGRRLRYMGRRIALARGASATGPREYLRRLTWSLVSSRCALPGGIATTDPRHKRANLGSGPMSRRADRSARIEECLRGQAERRMKRCKVDDT